MPGWHEATKDLRKQGKLRMVGIVEEQHPERARLFMQWKQMGWPILVDSLNLLGVAAVPITLAIDEYGVIRVVNPKWDSIDETFLSQTYRKPERLAPADTTIPDLDKLKRAAAGSSAASLRSYADAWVLWGNPARLDEAIAAYREALKLEPNHAPTNFRLGVAYRKRQESEKRQPQDFQTAVEYWTKALEMDPNQYVWRRRIQQYGPRLDKPYPFYDWVPLARQEIQARGQTPAPLTVEPGGAEFAEPLKVFEPSKSSKRAPDPQGRVLRDQEKFILTDIAFVPPAIAPGDSIRVHVTFRPNAATKAHWNNEAEGLVFWIDAPEGWQASDRYLTVSNPPAAVSLEPRTVEFELKAPGDAQKQRVTVPAYALYYVCEDVNGTCLYRRQDVQFDVTIRIKP